MTQAHAPLAVFPGSFDPFHVGHVSIVERAMQIFPRIIVGVLQNTGKESLFGSEERADMIREYYQDTPAVEVHSFSGLLVNFMQEMDATIIVRGMRAVSDFEYEFQMALMNRRLWPPVETVFLTPKEEVLYLSSRLVREVVALGGDVTGLVPENVKVRLEDRFGTPDSTPGG
ncbi:MAG: pantetheine-phosphate adenylyltransferase [Acidobacteriota bacterium]